MIKTMTNAEIFSLDKALSSAFNNETRYLPAKINFYIQKNRSVLANLSKDIEAVRMSIIEKYGTLEENEDQYKFSDANLKLANKELADLLNIVQEVQICTISLTSLEALDFTTLQMQALLFMIEED